MNLGRFHIEHLAHLSNRLSLQQTISNGPLLPVHTQQIATHFETLALAWDRDKASLNLLWNRNVNGVFQDHGRSLIGFAAGMFGNRISGLQVVIEPKLAGMVYKNEKYFLSTPNYRGFVGLQEEVTHVGSYLLSQSYKTPAPAKRRLVARNRQKLH